MTPTSIKKLTRTNTAETAPSSGAIAQRAVKFSLTLPKSLAAFAAAERSLAAFTKSFAYPEYFLNSGLISPSSDYEDSSIIELELLSQGL